VGFWLSRFSKWESRVQLRSIVKFPRKVNHKYLAIVPSRGRDSKIITPKDLGQPLTATKDLNHGGTEARRGKETLSDHDSPCGPGKTKLNSHPNYLCAQ
jgi:hypothetical protein